MKKMLILYLSPPDAKAQLLSATPEQQAQGMQAWTKWAKDCGTNLVDLGAELNGSKSLGPNGKITDCNNQLAGYSVLQASSMEEAVKLMKGNPHISGWHPGVTLEVHESIP